MTMMVWIVLAIVGLATLAAVAKGLQDRRRPPRRPDDPNM
jgi:hypothetical protein